MKAIRLISMAVVAIMFCLSLASCGSSDSVLTGNTFKVIGWANENWAYAGYADPTNPNPLTLTFNSDGTISQSKALYGCLKFTVDGNKLTIIAGEEANEPDERMVGTISVENSIVTFTYSVQDADDDSDDDDDDDDDDEPKPSLILQKL